MDLNIAMLLTTLVTNKPYLGLSRQAWDPVLFGLLLITTAVIVKRWLANAPNGHRHGFTYARLLASDRRVLDIVAAGSTALQPKIPPHHTVDGPQLGGGRSGGGGASGNF
jgi:hypothetical protein